MKKSTLIYGGMSIVILSMMLFPTSLTLFKLQVSDIRTLSNFFSFLPDIIGLISLGIGNGLLILFYKRHAKARKMFPYYVLLVISIWTLGTVIK